MQPTFSIKEALKESYGIIKPQFWMVVGQYALIACVFIVLNFLVGKWFLVSLVLSTLFSFASVSFGLAYAGRDVFSFQHFLSALTFKKVLIYFCTFLLADLAIFGGVLLLIIPGIIAAVQLRFVKYIAVEKDLTPMQALKESARLTKGSRVKIFEFILLCALINIVGAVCLLVGLFFTVPLTLIAFILVYKKLSSGPAPEEVTVSVDAVVVEAAVA